MYRFLPILMAGVVGAASIGGKVAPDRVTEIQMDMPESLHKANVGGSDGAGLCVFTSIEHAAIWQNVEALHGFQAWMRRYPGGGWPEKLDKKIKEYAASRGLPVPQFLQAEGRAADLLPLAEAALKSGRAVAVTYDFSPSGRYGGRRIAHMVNLVHLDAKHACVLDNNYIGVAKYEWMSRDDFARVLGNRGWVAILLDPGPPPLPWNGGVK